MHKDTEKEFDKAFEKRFYEEFLGNKENLSKYSIKYFLKDFNSSNFTDNRILEEEFKKRMNSGNIPEDAFFELEDLRKSLLGDKLCGCGQLKSKHGSGANGYCTSPFKSDPEGSTGGVGDKKND